MTTTEIEWTDVVWNPTKGCDRVSPGCDHCYAMTMAKRLKGMGQVEYQQDGDPRTSGPGFLAHEAPSALDFPLKLKTPKRIFVNSMSDLFHDNISDEFIAQVFAVMALAPRHTFQVLTKRHARMRSLLRSDGFWMDVTNARILLALDHDLSSVDVMPWPLTNVWLGVSVENQQWADIRIPALLDTPAAVRFLSCEPLLGSVDLRGRFAFPREDGPRIHWVIAGGESGPGARPMHPEWPRSLRDQCAAASVPFLFKQWGNWAALKQLPYETSPTARTLTTVVAGKTVFHVGKQAAGRELDGRTWDEYPAANR
jgi:protein gp37